MTAFTILESTGEYATQRPVTAQEIVDQAKAILREALFRPNSNCFTDPTTVRQFLKLSLATKKAEIFACLFLTNRHRLIRYEEMFRGTIDGASVHPREVVRLALHYNAAAVILAHNHPSGDPEPSQAAHWEVQRLKHLCRLETGHTPSRSEPTYWIDAECVIPWVSLNDTKSLSEQDKIAETRYRISPTGMANSSAHLIDAGAVVFTRDATIGLAAITEIPMAVSQHIIAWGCGPELFNWYLLRVISAMQQELDRLTFGATLKTIGMGAVREMVTPLPPLNEQRHIVDHLADELHRFAGVMTSVNRQIDRLQEYRHALIIAAVTGQLDIEAAA